MMHQLSTETVLFLVLCVLLLSACGIWLWLVFRLYRRLERYHPEKYLAMGKPTLFWRSSPASSFELLKFLFRHEHRGLNDTHLSRLCDWMRLCLLIHILLCFGVLFLMRRMG